LTTILVIDDEAGYRDMLKFELTMDGFSVLQAAGGREAFHVLSDAPVDLIITDMKMPEMDGLDVLTAVRKDHPRMPFVLMTGFALEERVQKALALKTCAYLKKPFAIDELKTALDAALASS
jgi:DNA-binding NtrC family response regulator